MNKTEAFQLLTSKISTCEKCAELTQYRKENSYLHVPGEGSFNAKIVAIGEAPGQDEGKSGRPFVGRAGQLLTKILEACGWKREEIYICNIIKCRPPSNREPEPGEAKNCRSYLDLQIKLVQPQWILCFGRIASVYLLGLDPDTTIGSLRKKVYDFRGSKVICTYHPSYLLRNPSAKQEVWDDLQVVISALQTAEVA